MVKLCNYSIFHKKYYQLIRKYYIFLLTNYFYSYFWDDILFGNLINYFSPNEGRIEYFDIAKGFFNYSCSLVSCLWAFL